MRVSYDISVLGMGHYNERARTGIARVIENLAVALDQRPDVDLRFCAHESLETWFKTRDYLAAQGVLRRDVLRGPRNAFGRTIANLYVKLGLASPRAHRSQNPFAKLHRRAQRIVGLNAQFFTNRMGLLDLDEPDVFHSPFLPFPRGIGAAGPASRFVTVYDLIPILFPQYFKFNEGRHLRRLIKRVGPSDYVFAISTSTKNDLCDYSGIDPARVFVTPLAASGDFRNCTDAVLMAATRQKYEIPDAPYVLSLCTLEPRKNIDQTIRCFIRVIDEEKIPDLNLVLVGTRGWKFDRIFEEIANSSELKKRIIVTGYVPDQDLSPLYSGAEMFVYPSYYEGFGLPPLEAMQCGVPVITSNTSSLPEVVGDAGIMVAPDDAEALCQAMLDLHHHEDLRAEMSAKGLARAATFSWERCAEDTVRGYRQALQP